MGRPRQYSDELILNTVRDCVLEHGPNVSTVLIAKTIGLSQAALFKRFKTKEQLFISALMPKDPAGWVRRFEAGPDERPIREQLLDVVDSTRAAMQHMIPILLLLQGSGIDAKTICAPFDVPPPVLVRQTLTAWFERAVDRGLLDTPEPEVLATVLMGAIHSRVMLQHILEDRSGFGEDDVFLQKMVDLLWAGAAVGGQG